MFKYYNANPNGEHIGDCVIRAISTATGIKYEDVLKYLYITSNYFNCDMLVRECYSKLLKKYTKARYIVDEDITVGELAERYKDKKLIMRVPNHLTSSRYGVVLDLWDCTNELVDTFWIVE